MYSHRIAVLAASCAALFAGRASASPTDLYGGFPRGVATAGTQTAAADDSGAALYNPAGVALAGAAGKAEMQLGYAYGLPKMSISRQKNDQASLDAHPTQYPDGQGWITLGATAVLGGRIRHRAALGFSFYLPQNDLVRVQALDPVTPQWTRYQSDPDRLVLAAGLGIRITDAVAVGIGAQLLASLSGTVNFAGDIGARKVTSRSVDFSLKPALTPTAGLMITPLPAWRFALSYRGALQLDINLPNDINVNGLGVGLAVTGTVLYTPPQIAVGTQFAPTDRWKLAFDLKVDLWSKAPFPGLAVAVGLKGETAMAIGLDKLTVVTNDLSPNFQNTVTPSVSTEFLFPGSGVVVRGGYSLRPPYAPNQVGGTNFLDNVTHIVGAGITIPFRDPLEIFAAPIKFDLALQCHYLQARSVAKAQTGDPVGDYDYSGFAVAGGAALRYEF